MQYSKGKIEDISSESTYFYHAVFFNSILYRLIVVMSKIPQQQIFIFLRVFRKKVLSKAIIALIMALIIRTAINLETLKVSTLDCLIAVHVRLFFFQIFGCMYGLIRHCMSIYTRITEFITYKKPKIITVCIIILSYLYVKYALLQACMFKNSLKQLCLYVYMDCTAIKHSRVFACAAIFKTGKKNFWQII